MQLDNNVQAFKRNQRGEPSYTKKLHLPPKQQPSYRHQYQKDSTALTGQGAYYGQGPMELDANGQRLSAEEKARRLRDHLCFKCGKPGHFSRNCHVRNAPCTQNNWNRRLPHGYPRKETWKPQRFNTSANQEGPKETSGTANPTAKWSQNLSANHLNVSANMPQNDQSRGHTPERHDDASSDDWSIDGALTPETLDAGDTPTVEYK